MPRVYGAGAIGLSGELQASQREWHGWPGNPERAGRILVDQLRVQGVDTVFGVPGESYLEVLDALHDTPEIRFVVCRQEGGAAMMADGLGRADRPARHRHGHARARGDQRQRRRARGPAGQRADDPVRRPDRPRQPRARHVPGGRLPADVRRHGQVGGRDRRRRAHPRVRPPGVRHRHRRPARAGGAGAAGGHAGRDRRRRRRSAGRRRSRPAPAPSAMAELQRLLATAERPFVILGGGGWDADGRRRPRALPRRQRPAGGLRLPPAGPARQRAPLLRRPYRARPQPEAGRTDQGQRPACWPSAAGSARPPARASRCWTCRARRQAFVHVHNDPEELGRVYQPDLAITVRPQRLRHAPRARSRRSTRRPWAEATAAAHAEELAWRRADPDRGRAAARRDRGLVARAAFRPTRSSPTAPATTRSGPTDTSPIAASGPSWRRPPARWATACRPPSPPSCATPSGRSSASPATAASS